MEGQFRPVRRLTKWLFWLYIVLIILTAGAIASGYAYADLINRIISGEFITEAEIATTEFTYGAIGVPQIVLYYFVIILFFIWIYRTHKNLPYLNVEGLRFTPGWSVGYFFVPFMSLFRPYQMMAEKWKASNPKADMSDKESWKTSSPSPIVGGWWAFFLTSIIAAQIAFQIGWRGGEQLSDLLTATYAMLVSDATDVGWILTSIFLVRRIAQFQEAKYRLITSA